MKTAKEIVDGLQLDGFDLMQIRNAMTDGEYLKTEGISQEIAEEAFLILKAMIEEIEE